jgi:hypothetical protein
MGTGPGAEDPPVESPVESSVESSNERHDEPAAVLSDELRDTALHEEIELVGQLVVAATSTPDRLSQEQIDKVLGVEPED